MFSSVGASFHSIMYDMSANSISLSINLVAFSDQDFKWLTLIPGPLVTKFIMGGCEACVDN